MTNCELCTYNCAKTSPPFVLLSPVLIVIQANLARPQMLLLESK